MKQAPETYQAPGDLQISSVVGGGGDLDELQQRFERYHQETQDQLRERDRQYSELSARFDTVNHDYHRVRSLASAFGSDGRSRDHFTERQQASDDLRGYSVAKAIQESLNGRLTGLEAEVHADLAQGRETRGVMVPTRILLEHRAVTTTTPVGGPGSNLVGREMMPITEYPRPVLLIEKMGATVMRNLTGNVDLPRLAGSGDAFWIAEHEDVPRSDPKFAAPAMGPKTVGAEYEISRRMILQSSEAIEELLRRDLQSLLRQALDGAAIKGAGGVEPVGIINTAGITVTSAAFTSDLAADMIGALDLDDISETRAFITHPEVMTIARKVKDQNDLLIPVADQFHQQRVEVSTQVTNAEDPADPLLIYGQWSELVIGYWSGVDILANPYHKDVASKGGMLLHAFLDTDVVVRTVEAFQARVITG